METRSSRDIESSIRKWPVIGNERIVGSLKNIILKDKIPHALLFSGLSGLGKSIVAQNFIKTVLCSDKKNRPCGKCDSCLRVDSNVHPDLINLNNRSSLKIKEIRNLKHKLALSPSISNYKVCLLAGTDNLTEEAANALLKVLEEPQGNTVIILLTENYESLLDTIISRCVLFEFFPLHEREIRKIILAKNKKIEKDLLENIVLRSSGRAEMANSYLQEPSQLKSDDQILTGMLEAVFKSSDDFQKINYAAEIAKDYKGKLVYVLNVWTSFFHQLILDKLGIAEYFDNRYKGVSDQLTLGKVKNVIGELNRAKALLTRNINKKLLLENLFLNI